MEIAERTKEDQIKSLLQRARACSNKGRMYVYESFKRELQQINVTPEEYEQTCRQLAKYLRV